MRNINPLTDIGGGIQIDGEKKGHLKCVIIECMKKLENNPDRGQTGEPPKITASYYRTKSFFFLQMWFFNFCR